MFRISRKQVEALERAVVADFQGDMFLHLAATFPDEVGALGQENAQRLISTGMSRAATHGLVTELDVCLFLHLMVVLGTDFDTNSALVAIGDALCEEGSPPSARIERAYDIAVELEDAATNKP